MPKYVSTMPIYWHCTVIYLYRIQYAVHWILRLLAQVFSAISKSVSFGIFIIINPLKHVFLIGCKYMNSLFKSACTYKFKRDKWLIIRCNITSILVQNSSGLPLGPKVWKHLRLILEFFEFKFKILIIKYILENFKLNNC